MTVGWDLREQAFSFKISLSLCLSCEAKEKSTKYRATPPDDCCLHSKKLSTLRVDSIWDGMVQAHRTTTPGFQTCVYRMKCMYVKRKASWGELRREGNKNSRKWLSVVYDHAYKGTRGPFQLPHLEWLMDKAGAEPLVTCRRPISPLVAKELFNRRSEPNSPGSPNFPPAYSSVRQTLLVYVRGGRILSISFHEEIRNS